MRSAGPIIGMPFSLEGFAFFTEAIFLGVYLYGWERVSRRAHLAAGVLVAVSGALSGIFVVIANAWMNTPTGFELVAGRAVNVDPLAAMANPAALPQAVHMTLAAYAATGLGVAGIHAFLLLKDPSNAFHRRALVIALLVGGTARLAWQGPRPRPPADAGTRPRHAHGVHRDRSGLGRDGSGSPALGDLRGPEDRGRRHADAGAHRAVSHVHPAVLLSGCDRELALVPSDHPQSPGHRMSLAELVAGIIVVALNAYALLGGADFGGGVWDLLARGPRRERQRQLIAEAIGPVWEANHVWLILAIVLLFTCFPPAFARLGTLLHIPLSLVLIGIVLRGSAFTFWRYGGGAGGGHGSEPERHWGVVFAIASLITPLLLGTTVGSIASGALGEGERGKGEGFFQVYVGPWLTPFALSVGVFALIAFAFLAAVYLTLEAQERELQEDFRRRALGAGVALFFAALAALLLSQRWAPRVREALIFAPWAVPLHLLTAATAVTALAALWRRRWRVARVAAATQVSLILWGWALAQYPYVLPPDLPVEAAAAPAVTLRLVLAALAPGALVLLPSLYYLLRSLNTLQPSEGP